MHIRRQRWRLVLVLAIAAQGAAHGAAHAEPSSADIDLGSATLERNGAVVGPTRIALGVTRFLTIGTHPILWIAPALAPGSFSASGFAKASHRTGRITLAARGTIVYARLADLDDDGLDARALLLPFRATADLRLSRRWIAGGELAGVAAKITATRPSNQDTDINGVAIANSAHVGATLRYRANRRWTLWLRSRFIVAHAPVTAEGDVPLSEDARAHIKARANAADLAAGASFMAGFHWQGPRFNVRIGVGYGHWVLPWIQLPVGEAGPTADLAAYWRF